MSFKEEVKSSGGVVKMCNKVRANSAELFQSGNVQYSTCNMKKCYVGKCRVNTGTAWCEERSPFEYPPAIKWQPHIFQIAATAPSGMNPLNGPLNH